jgi:hypothetical protein
LTRRLIWCFIVWDQLGEVVYSPGYQEELKAVDMEAVNALDNAFITEVIAGVKARNGEEWTRCMFRDYASHIIAMAQEEELFTDAATKSAHQEANQFRINNFLKSRQYKTYTMHKKVKTVTSAFREMDPIIRHHVRNVQVRKVAASELVGIFNDFLRYINTHDEVYEFLAMLPDSQGGLQPVATCLFHKHPK